MTQLGKLGQGFQPYERSTEQGSGINSVTRSALHSVIHFDVRFEEMKKHLKGVSPSFHAFGFDCLFYCSFIKTQWHVNPELNIQGPITT